MIYKRKKEKKRKRKKKKKRKRTKEGMKRKNDKPHAIKNGLIYTV
jgi:hypothetical protein